MALAGPKLLLLVFLPPGFSAVARTSVAREGTLGGKDVRGYREGPLGVALRNSTADNTKFGASHVVDLKIADVGEGGR